MAHHTVVVFVLDPQYQVAAKADHQKEVEHRSPTHLSVDQATEVLLETGLGLSLAPEEDQGHVQDHKMLKDHGNCINAGFNGRRLFEDR